MTDQDRHSVNGPAYDAERGGAIWNRRMSSEDGAHVASWKAGHMLRMHWACVQHRRLAEWSDQ